MSKIPLRLLSLLVLTHSALTQEFQWVKRTESPETWGLVEKAFVKELTPDRPGETGNVVPMTEKRVTRIGTFKDSALVLIEYRENSSDPYPIFRAFNFNLKSQTKTVIGVKEASWFSMWRFLKIAYFEDHATPDVVFRYLSCTECEAESLLASFRFESSSGIWTVRHWSAEDGDSVLIGSDHQYGEDGIYDFDCLHTVSDLNGDGLDDVAVRCRESVEGDRPGETSKIAKDETLLYSLRDNVFSRSLLLKGPDSIRVKRALCSGHVGSPLCRE